MPFYDLRCTSCQNEFNIKASVEERTAQRIPCPDCGSHLLQPVFKAAHFTVKQTEAACPNSHICGSGCCGMH